MWVKTEPNEHEVALIQRGQKYISKLANIPGVELIAIVNSLSMYATHPESDIDLFIVTRPGTIWFVRFWATLILWTHGVWRRDRDIAGNLCLSFFITTEAMDLSHIAIENDIYLYYWIYYMRPIIDKNGTYEKFLLANSWVDGDEEQRKMNKKWQFKVSNSVVSVIPGLSRNLGNKEGIPIYAGFLPSQEWQNTRSVYKKLNTIIRYLLFPRTQSTYEKLGQPEWVIISDQMLKFHNRDRRKAIRDTIFENNFDK